MDPDKDTVVTRQLTRKELLGREDQLLQLVGRLLDKANYFMVCVCACACVRACVRVCVYVCIQVYERERGR